MNSRTGSDNNGLRLLTGAAILIATLGASISIITASKLHRTQQNYIEDVGAITELHCNARIDSVRAEMATISKHVVNYMVMNNDNIAILNNTNKSMLTTIHIMARMNGIPLEDMESESLTPFNKEDWK